MQFLWVEVVFLFLIEACADFVQLLFSFYLGVSNSHYVLFGDPSHCKPGPVHGLTVGRPSCECVDVEVIPCMIDETGWIFFFCF